MCCSLLSRAGPGSLVAPDQAPRAAARLARSGFARRPEAGFRREAFAELPPCTAVLCNPWRSNTRSLVPRVETRPRRARSSLCPGCLARRFGLGLLTGAFEVGLRGGLG